MVFYNFTNFLGCLLQIVISVYLLYQIIGPSVFAGIGAMLFTIPLVGMVMRKNRGLEVQMSRKLNSQR